MSDHAGLQDIKIIYDEVCRSHDGIAEFRAKLLGLLPLASGVGIFLLVGNEAVTQGDTVSHLIPVGLFGLLITLGLFLHELRGIQKCNALIECAKALERELLPYNNLWKYGAFNFRQRSYRNFVGVTGAALVIYPTVFGSWGYILAVGLAGSLDLNTWGKLLTLLLAAFLMALAFLMGFTVNKANNKRLNEEKSTIEIIEED